MIELQNVSKIYKNNKYAINDISLAINDGEFVYVVGHSGAGKSTLLRLIYRQEKATKGKIIVNGRDISKIRYNKVPHYRREVGFVFQDYQLLQHKTAYENIAYALEVRGEHRLRIQKRVRDVLDLVGLKDKEKSYPSQLSGGEQQRVAIARAIINRPSILIADEPTGNLDPMTSKTVIEVLEAINELGTTVVVATHDQYLVNNYPQRTITFKNGIVYQDALDRGYVVGDENFDTDITQPIAEQVQADISILDVVRNELEDVEAYPGSVNDAVGEVQEEFLELVAEQEKKRQETAEEEYIKNTFGDAKTWTNSTDRTLFSAYSDDEQLQKQQTSATKTIMREQVPMEAEQKATRASRRGKGTK